jgi:hypothetical protein
MKRWRCHRQIGPQSLHTSGHFLCYDNEIAEALQLKYTLVKELLKFQLKINISTAHDPYEAWREGDHDDLVLSI